MGPNGETVRLVAQALQVEENGVVHWQGQFAPIHQVKHLPPRIPIRPFGDPDKSHVLNAHFLQNTAHGIQLPTATVDQHQIGPVTLLPLRILLLRTSEAAFQHFAHHRKIVARHCLCPFDVELAIGVFAETLRPRHNHGAQRVGALNLAVVVNLDTVRRPVQSEQVRNEEHTSELQSLMRNSYAVFCLKKKKTHKNTTHK